MYDINSGVLIPVNPVDPMRPHVPGTYLPDAPACARHSIMVVEVSPSAE